MENLTQPVQEPLRHCNQIRIVGKVTAPPAWCHRLHNEDFYLMQVAAARLSGTVDTLPVTLCQRLMDEGPWREGDRVEIHGQIRSYNRQEGDRTRLILTVYAFTLAPCLQEEDVNETNLTGTLCRPPHLRTTPFMRRITDLILAINRPYHKSDYIPVITWGVRAAEAGHLAVGQSLRIRGRLQSREYVKRTPGQPEETRTAYEVSVTTLETWEEKE